MLSPRDLVSRPGLPDSFAVYLDVNIKTHTRLACVTILYEPCHEKTCLRGFRPGPTQLKPSCSATEDDSRLAISDLESRVIVIYLCSENKDARYAQRICDLICVFAFAYAKGRHSQNATSIRVQVTCHGKSPSFASWPPTIC